MQYIPKTLTNLKTVLLIIILLSLNACASYTNIRALKSLQSNNEIKEIALLGGASIRKQNSNSATLNLAYSKQAIESSLIKVRHILENKGYKVVYSEAIGLGHKWPVMSENWFTIYDENGYVANTWQIKNNSPAFEYPATQINEEFRLSANTEFERINNIFGKRREFFTPKPSNIRKISKVTGGDIICFVYTEGKLNANSQDGMVQIIFSKRTPKNIFKTLIACSNSVSGKVVYANSQRVFRINDAFSNSQHKELLNYFPKINMTLDEKCKLVDKSDHIFYCSQNETYIVPNYEELDPFHIAAKIGALKQIKRFIKHKAGINDRSGNDGKTPLIFAVANGHFDVAKELLENGAEVDKHQDDGTTPLHWAAYMGSEEMINLLLSFKANININPLDRKFGTPLHWAAGNTSRNPFNTTRLLINKGANVNAKASNGSVPLHWVDDDDYGAKITMLLLTHGSDINAARHNDKATPLFIAAERDNIEVARILLKNGANIEQPNKHGLTPLHIAAWNGSNRVAKLLIKNNANIHALTNKKYTAILMAAGSYSPIITQELISAGASIDPIDENGWTPLHRASSVGSMNTVKMLLQYGANANAVTTDDSTLTPLHMAVHRKSLAVIKLLLKYGVKTNIADANGLTPIRYITLEERPVMYKLLNKKQ